MILLLVIVCCINMQLWANMKNVVWIYFFFRHIYCILTINSFFKCLLAWHFLVHAAPTSPQGRVYQLHYWLNDWISVSIVDRVNFPDISSSNVWLRRMRTLSGHLREKTLHTRVLGFIPSGNFLLEPLTITDATKLIIHKYVSNLFLSFMIYVELPP